MLPVFSCSASFLLCLQQVTCFLSAGYVKEELREIFHNILDSSLSAAI